MKNKFLLYLLFTPFLTLAQEREYRFVVKPDQTVDYSHTIATLRKNTFVVLSPYQDSVAFEIGDFTGTTQALKIKLFYFGDSCFLVGSEAAYDTVFSTLHRRVRFNKRLQKRIDYDLKVDGLYPFTVVVDSPSYRYFSVIATKVIHE